MKRTLILLCIVAVITGVIGSLAIEQEPNWTNRYREVYQRQLESLKYPAVGQRVTIVRRIGGEYSGKIRSISSNSVSIGGNTYVATQLTDESCEEIFPERKVAKLARQQVLKERDAFRERQALEQKKRAEAEQALANIERQKRLDVASRSTNDKRIDDPLPQPIQTPRATHHSPPPSPHSSIGDSSFVVFLIIGALAVFAVLIANLASVNAPLRSLEEKRRNLLRAAKRGKSVSANIMKCPHCRGSGDVLCNACKGTGRRVCSKCGGKGRVYLDTEGVKIGSVGKLGRHWSVEGEKREEQCLTCHGSGYQNVKCPTCKGDGNLICPICNGEKSVSEFVANDYQIELLRQKKQQAYGRLITFTAVVLLGGIIFKHLTCTPNGTNQSAPPAGNSGLQKSSSHPVPVEEEMGWRESHPEKSSQHTIDVEEKTGWKARYPEKLSSHLVEVKDNTDWEARYAEIYRILSDRFSSPKVGQAITIRLAQGSEYRGTLLTLDESSLQIKLESGAVLVFQNTQLDIKTRAKCFRDDFATLYARRQLEKEKNRK